MRFEDDNFEEEFLRWLNTKTQEEIIEGLKKYIVEEQYEYSFFVDENLNIESPLDYIEVEIDDKQKYGNKTYLKENSKKKHQNVDINKIIELEDAA